MDKPVPIAPFELVRSTDWGPATPLWQRVPTRCAEGKLLGDFMMLIPRLNRLDVALQQEKLVMLSAALNRNRPAVEFAEMNLRLNLLWVSFRPAVGNCAEIAGAIQNVIPEALLVSSRFDGV
ncbi:MAG: hypothetical protein ACFCUG_06640 [Thiotrichales bacterium]